MEAGSTPHPICYHIPVSNYGVWAAVLTSDIHAPGPRIPQKRKPGFIESLFLSNVFNDVGGENAYGMTLHEETPEKHLECGVCISGLLFPSLPSAMSS